MSNLIVQLSKSCEFSLVAQELPNNVSYKAQVYSILLCKIVPYIKEVSNANDIHEKHEMGLPRSYRNQGSFQFDLLDTRFSERMMTLLLTHECRIS
jgi:hypothetical protein